MKTATFKKPFFPKHVASCVDAGNKIHIFAGEGDVGSRTEYTGGREPGQIYAKLKREGGGGRWARAIVFGYEAIGGTVGYEVFSGEAEFIPEMMA